MNNTKYEFTVKTLRYGQVRPYAESIYDFIIESEQPEFVVKNFCTKVLQPSTQEYKDWKSYREDPMSYFAGYHHFEKIKDNTYKYHVIRPYTD